jgi:hypothetical protein
MDFNVYNMSAVVHAVERENVFGVAELTKMRDTPQMIRILKERFQSGKNEDRSIVIYPDASGSSRSTVNASKSDISLLREAGFYVDAPPSNPPIRDRVISLSSKICNGAGAREYFINSEECPEAASNLEQQANDNAGEPDKSHGHDHTNEAVGYFVDRLWPIRRPLINANARGTWK